MKTETNMTTIAIATRINYLPSHYSRRAGEYVSGKFYPRSDARYTVLTTWGEQHFRTLGAARKYAVIAKKAKSFTEACHMFAAA